MPNIKSFILNQPSDFFKEAIGDKKTISLKYSDIQNNNSTSTSSYKYNVPGGGIKSTQQIPIDWSKFENHTFFNSAQAKVNVSFDKIINRYPFDGDLKETEDFLDKLTGFEKYVFDQFPKNKGYLLFNNSHIEVADRAGTEFPTLSKNNTGKTILDPGNKSFTIELQLFVPDTTNDVQIVCQKFAPGTNHGFTLFVSESASTDVADVHLLVTSGTTWISSSAEIQKGKFNHVAAVFNKKSELNQPDIFVNLEKTSDNKRSSAGITFGTFDFATSSLLVGTGSSVQLGSAGFMTPKQTLSGAIDEFRVFHDVRTENQQKLFAQKGIFTDDTLKLYFKFNEPTGTLGSTTASGVNSIVLDSSGNSLHSSITGFDFSLRNTASLGPAVPMKYEKLQFNPILFPAEENVISLNTRLLSSASLYDNENPNLVTKLFPQHYFVEGKVKDGLEEIDGTINDGYTGAGMPGTAQLGSAQLLTTLLFVYANFFDELKIVTDSFSKLIYSDYKTTDTIPSEFLTFLSDYYGFKIPSTFFDATQEQFLDGENITRDIETSELSLQKVQNELTKRILADIQNIIKSKGTIHSIKSLIRNLGIDPDNSLRIREFGGPRRSNLRSEREKQSYSAGMLNMSSSQSYVTSSYLSGSRIEIGYPEIQGTYVAKDTFSPHGISDNVEDGLFTSGSWTCEALYTFLPKPGVTQSLMRVHTTGSSVAIPSPPTTSQPVVNLTAVSASVPSIKLFVAPGYASLDYGRYLELELTGADIFDGNLWNVSFGRYRNDSISSIASSSYFLRCARQNDGEIKEFYATSSYFQDSVASRDVFQNIDATYNQLGSFITFGSESIDAGSSALTYQFLNNTAAITDDLVRATDFNGKISNIRFWSKPFSSDEWKEHSRNRQSLGVNDPINNFNFEKVSTGSFERLRMDLDITQDITASNATGEILLTDFSQNGITATGINFEPNKKVIEKQLKLTSYFSPYFDESAATNKVRIRGIKNSSELSDFPYAQVAPVYELQKSEEVIDDPRFSIDFSLVDALNRDIMNIFSTLETLDDALGNPTDLFSSDYTKLLDIRDVYFNRLTDKIRLNEFFQLFKWFDGLINSFIRQLLPRKTKFLGANFVLEQHVLERSRLKYLYSDAYLSEGEKALPTNSQTNLNGKIGI
jgi:hypothetical protein